MCGTGFHQVQAAVVAAAAGGFGVGVDVVGVVVVAAQAAHVNAELGVGFEDAGAVLLGSRESARMGKVVMVDWLELVVLWLDVDEVGPVAAAVEAAVCWNTRELENGPERMVD